jgi:hypothetical protein
MHACFDGSHAVVHGHLAPHHHVAHDDSAPGIEPADRVIWLETAAVDALPFQLHVPAAVLTRHAGRVSPSPSWSVIALDDCAPPHGPPGALASLRAPPAFPV